MRALTVIILVLATIWCAGNVILGAVAAKGVFVHAPPHADLISREVAGAIFGKVLERWSFAVDVGFLPLIGVLLLLLAGALLNLKRIGVMVLCLATLGGIAGVHLWSRTILHDALVAAPPTDPKAPYSDEQRETFNTLHKRSTNVFSAEAGLLLLLIIGCGVALGRQSDPVVTSASPTNH
ncbi:MAG: hypothetical protein H0W78_19605 [Planctomycetes bacterium]|nr:hypothetical protein [Planctomycetota bacterium]